MHHFVETQCSWLLYGWQPNAGQKKDVFTELLSNPMLFLMLIFLLFFIIVIFPQQRQSKQQQKALADALKNLKKNDRVVTIGGIHGIVVTASNDSPTVTIRIDEASNARITINREAVAKVVNDESKPAT